LLGIVVVIFIFLISDEKFTEKLFGINSVKYKYGGKLFNVSSEFNDKKNAAERQKDLISDIDRFINILDKKYSKENMSGIHGNMFNHKNMINNFKRRWEKDNFYEGTPNSKDSSFTIGKGDYFVICMRNKNGEIHDEITLSFVVLHEIAHIMNNNYGHGEDFWLIFKWLLKEYEDVYNIKFPDYNKFPEEYCNTKIFSNPLYDHSF